MENQPKLSYPVIVFLAARLVLVMGLPLDGLRGYGDLGHYFDLARLGWPYFEYWIEFPPFFPFLSVAVYRLAGGSEHSYVYLLTGLFSLAQAGGMALFLRLASRLYGEARAVSLGWIYFGLLVVLPYGWWTFDALAVFWMLMGLTWFMEGHDGRTGLVLGLGILTKWFPGLILAAAWKSGGLRRGIRPSITALGLAGIVLAGLYLVAPENTRASLVSQAGKGSWETAWALMDGNFQTGNFGPQIDPLDPETASLQSRNPPRISPWLSLPFFVAVGLWLTLRTRSGGDREAVAFTGLAWCLFLVWMPGYSPQWVTYLLPLILLALPGRSAVLACLVLVFVNLLEWPVLLSRGLFWSLWLTVPLRTALHLMIGWMFWSLISDARTVANLNTGMEDAPQPAA